MIPLSRLLCGDWPDAQPVARRRGQILTLGRLRADVAANAAGLRARQIGRAALYTQDSYWFLVGMLALLQADATILLPPNGQPGTLAAAAAEADLLVADPGVEPGFTLLDGTVPAPPQPALDAAHCRLEFFTSGSTGARKRIGKTLDQLEAEVAVLDALWGETLGAVTMVGMASHQHIFGLTFRLLWPAMAGRPFDAETHLAWETLLPALAGPTALVASPAHLTRLGGLVPLAPEQRPRAIFTAGAPVPMQAAEDSAAILGQAPVEIFGSTETGAIAWRRQTRAAVPWTPLPGVALAIGAAGALRITSPFLPAGTAYDSPDLVERDGEGFQFRGRSDRVAKIEGKRISLPEIERELAALPEVANCAVAPLSEGRDLLGAVVVLTAAGRATLSAEGKAALDRRLRKALSATGEAVGLPRRWRYVDTVPVDGMGKPDRAAILRLLARRPADAPLVQAVRAAERRVELDLLLPSGLAVFDGHFDGFPILPGVVQLNWAVNLARQHLPVTGHPGQLAQLKFRLPIRPRDFLALKLELQTQAGRDWVVFDYRRDGEICSSGRIAFTLP
jgi:acyl-coenzyme A synthetase/AMP-(fatty) acid ligase/3-hydroxymyristoyl/3-hydroxydecanoyl-(acyl carrier protein) dehydratase